MHPNSTVVKIILKVLKVHYSITTFSSFIGILAGPLLNCTPLPTNIPLDVQATTDYMQGSLLERPSAITASAKDPTKIPLDTAIASCTKANKHGEGRKLRSWVGKRPRT